MRFLLDENVSIAIFDALRSRGHDVAHARDLMKGAADPDVPARADAEARTLVTFDKDYGELAFRLRRSARHGIVLFRAAILPVEAEAEFVVAHLEASADWAEQFAVVTETRVRIRRLATPPDGGPTA